jgi:hypothetical protein
MAMRTEPWGSKVRLITDFTVTAIGKKKWRYSYRLFGVSSHRERASEDLLLQNN